MAPDFSRDEVAATCRRVWLLARHTLSEVLRLRLARLFAAIGVAIVLVALRLREFSFGTAELKFMMDFGLGATGLLGTLLAALATAQVIFEDIENGFAACLLAKAVHRWEYLSGRLVGLMALLILFVAGLAALLAILVHVRAAQLGAASLPPLVFLQACALVWLKTTLVAAMTLLVCSYADSALFASCAGLLLTAIAHLRSFAGQESWLGWLRIWPNLGAFDVDPLLSSGQAFGVQDLLSLGAYWLLFMVLFTGLSAFVFNRREF